MMQTSSLRGLRGSHHRHPTRTGLHNGITPLAALMRGVQRSRVRIVCIFGSTGGIRGSTGGVVGA